MSCPLIMNYQRGTEITRPTVIAALLSAGGSGVIQPPDGERWFQRDLNELHARNLAYPFQMRVDRLWFYRLSETGHLVAHDFRDEGWSFDGYDCWLADRLIR